MEVEETWAACRQAGVTYAIPMSPKDYQHRDIRARELLTSLRAYLSVRVTYWPVPMVRSRSIRPPPVFGNERPSLFNSQR